MLCKIDKTDSLSLILRQWSTYLSLCKSYKCSLNLSCDPIFWERYREREREWEDEGIENKNQTVLRSWIENKCEQSNTARQKIKVGSVCRLFVFCMDQSSHHADARNFIL